MAGGATTVYVHDAFGQLAAEYNSVGVTPACTTCYLTYDMLGTPRLITDQSQNVVTRHDYTAYGVEIPNGTAGRNGNFGYNSNVTQGFTGQEADSGTASLIFFHARHMSGVLGGFVQPDPANAGADITSPQSWNAYGYVLGNPLGAVDPSERSFVPCERPDSLVCVTNDPDFATSAEPYKDFYSQWQFSNQFLNTPSSCNNCGANSGADNQNTNQNPQKTGNPPTIPWYKNPCIKNAVGNGLLHVGIDSLGLIPEAGGVAREIGHQFLYRGVVADQFGARVVKTVGFGAGIIAAFARTAPVIGQAISVVSIGVDLYSAGKDIAACSN